MSTKTPRVHRAFKTKSGRFRLVCDPHSYIDDENVSRKYSKNWEEVDCYICFKVRDAVNNIHSKTLLLKKYSDEELESIRKVHE